MSYRVSSDARADTGESRVDLVALWRVVWGYKLLIGACSLFFGLVAVYLALTAIPIYRAEVAVTEVTNTGGLGAAGTGTQLVAPAVAQGAEQVAQLVAPAEPAGAGEDGGVGVLDQVEIFDQVFPNHGRVQSRAAARENNTTDGTQFRRRHVQSAELGGALFSAQAAAHRVAD